MICVFCSGDCITGVLMQYSKEKEHFICLAILLMSDTHWFVLCVLKTILLEHCHYSMKEGSVLFNDALKQIFNMVIWHRIYGEEPFI